jgi:hypothetical protein
MKDANNIYYLFSTAAQSIAAFLGLLIAGYTLVLSMMEAAARADETLDEVYEELKREFHRQLKKLSIVTAMGIIGSLLVLLVNKYDCSWIPLLATVVFFLVVWSICGGIRFVIEMIDPAKYQTAAKRLAQDIEAPSSATNNVSRGSFVEIFIRIEQLVRQIWQEKTQEQRLGQRQGLPSFREMLEVLLSNDIIGKDLYAKLMSVSKHRNVIVHGQVDFVNPDVFQEAESAQSQLDEIAKGNNGASSCFPFHHASFARKPSP